MHITNNYLLIASGYDHGTKVVDENRDYAKHGQGPIINYMSDQGTITE